MISFKKIAFTAALAALATTSISAYADHAGTSKKLTSAEIESLATVAAIDKGEILVSEIAVNKKSDSDVMDYAKMMINMHGTNLTHIVEMANQFHVTSLASSAGSKIMSENAKDILTLGGLEGKEFDKAYIDAMVAGHQAALTMLDNQLLKTAKSPEIKQFLTDVRGVVTQHLDAAKKIQGNLKS